MLDAQCDPMSPPTYHLERTGAPAPLWAATPRMEQNTRIPPAVDAINDAKRIDFLHGPHRSRDIRRPKWGLCAGDNTRIGEDGVGP